MLLNDFVTLSRADVARLEGEVANLFLERDEAESAGEWHRACHLRDAIDAVLWTLDHAQLGYDVDDGVCPS